MRRAAGRDQNSDAVAAIAVGVTVVVGVLATALALVLVGGMIVGSVPVPATIAVLALGLMAHGSRETWRDRRHRRGQPARRPRGLLEGAREAIEPFVYWSFLGLFGVVPLVVAPVVIAVAVLAREPGLAVLAVVPAGFGLACSLSWRSWHRDRRRGRRRRSA